MKKYCIHPGIKQGIGYHRLIELYGIDPEDCGQYDAKTQMHRGQICLRPKQKGSYGPKNEPVR